MPLILSINININDFYHLNSKRDYINKIFLKKIKLYKVYKNKSINIEYLLDYHYRR